MQSETLIKKRFWTSYDEDSGNGTILLQLSSWSLVIKAIQNLLPLLFVLTLPCISRIADRLYLWYQARCYARAIQQHDHSPINDGESSSFSGSLPSIGNIRNRRVVPSNWSPNNATGPDKPRARKSVWWWLVTIPLSLSWLCLGQLLAMLSTSHQFLVSSPECGLTSLSLSATYTQYLLDQQYQSARERSAAEEVESCRAGEPIADASLCDLLHVSIEREQSCPFTENLCHSNNSTTILQTDWISIRRLGLNAKDDIFFQHTATCTPLDMTHPRLKAEPLDSVLKLSWLHSYYYGEVDGAYSTYQLISTVFNFKDIFATFATDVLSENNHAKYDRAWTADAGLHHDVNTSLTLIFASRPADIFQFLPQAANPVPDVIDTNTLPLPVACVEYQEFCNFDKTRCYSTIKSDYPASEFELISQLMQRSSLADAIRYSGGRAVLKESTTPDRSGNSIDSNDDDDDDDDDEQDPYFDSRHWSRALERQFQASIAMLYNNMREFALGTGAVGEAYVRDERLDPFCGSYKITLYSTHLWSCRVWRWLIFATLPLLLFILTRQWEIPGCVRDIMMHVGPSHVDWIDKLGLLEDDAVSYWFDDRCLVAWVLLAEPCVWAGGKVECCWSKKGAERGAVRLE